MRSEHITQNNSINTIRLIYVGLEKFERTGDGKKIGKTFLISNLYVIPNGMKFKDATKIISYLSKKVEKENDIEEASKESVSLVLAQLENYGFKKIECKYQGYHHDVQKYTRNGLIKTNYCPQMVCCIDLFTVGGDFDLFKRTDLYDRYFDWYDESVKEIEIKNLYKNNKRR